MRITYVIAAQNLGQGMAQRLTHPELALGRSQVAAVVT